MASKLFKQLLIDVRSGNFEEANHNIQSKELEVHNSNAAKIVIECCRIFVSRELPADVNEQELYKLLVTCTQHIKEISDALLLGYMQSLFHILKYLIMKRKFELLTQMQDILIPQFMGPLKTPELIQTYRTVCSLIHSAICDLQNSQEVDSIQWFCQLCVLSVQINFKKLPTVTSLADVAFSYFRSSKFNAADADLQYSCYINILQLVKKAEICTDENTDDTYCSVVKLLEVVVNNLLTKKEFNKVRQFVNMILSEIFNLYSKESYLKLINALQCISLTIIYIEEEKDSSELLRNNFQNCLKDIVSYSGEYGLTPALQSTCTILGTVFRQLVEHYTKLSPALLKTKFTEEVLISLFKLLRGIGQIISQIKTKCVVCSNCSGDTEISTAVDVYLLVGKLLKVFITEKTDVLKSSVVALRYFECCCSFAVSLHDKKCSSWKIVWRDVGITIYNIAIKLYSIKHYKSADYFNVLIKTYMKLEGTGASAVFTVDVLSQSFVSLSEVYGNSHQFEMGLLYAAMQALFSSNAEKKLQQWVRIKYRSKDSGVAENQSLQALTIVCVLQQNKDEIRRMYPDFNLELDEAVMTNLLVAELTYYKKTWPSQIPMVSVLKKLNEFADLLTVVKALIQIWCNTWNFNFVNDEIYNVLNQVFPKFKLEVEQTHEGDVNEIEKKLYLAMLYVIRYYAQMHYVRQKNANDIKRTVLPEDKDTNLPPGELPKHPNDSCDLVSSYVSLKLDEHMKTMKLLRKALTLLSDCISDTPYIVSILEDLDVFGLVEKIATEFRLQCDSLCVYQTWLLNLKISRMSNNKLKILQSISFLLETANMHSEVICTLLADAETIINELSAFPSDELHVVLTDYHIQKSKMLLCHAQVKEGFEEYQKAVTCFTKMTQTNLDPLLKIRLDFLHVQYLYLPCDAEIEGHSVYSLAKLSEVYENMLKHVEAKANPSFLATALLFEINQSVAHIYRWKCLPREVRCYSRSTVKLAQQLVLPLRTAYFLTYLAYADLQSTRLDDCQVKLNGLSDILCLDETGSISLKTEDKKDEAISKLDPVVNDLTEDFAEMILDCPTSACKYQASLGSPVLLTKPFGLPPFMKHSVECDCFYCVSVEYKNLVLTYVNLKADLSIRHNDKAAVQTSFNGALHLYKNIFRRGKRFKDKVIKVLFCYPFHDLQDVLCLTYCVLLLHYGDNLLRIRDVKKAECFNKKLVSLILERQYENIYLYNEVLLQSIIVDSNMRDLNNSNKQKYLQVDTEVFVHDHELPKTPETKQTNVVVFPTSCSPRPNSPPKRRVRIKCDFSEKKSENSKSVKKSDQLPFTIHVSPKRKCGRLKFALPVDNKAKDEASELLTNMCKTPAAAACTTAMHVPSSIKTVKKQTVLQAIPVPASQTTPVKTNELPELRQSLFVVPASPDAYTPNSLKVSSVLHSRTKLLTAKLKKSAAKNGDENKLHGNIHSDQSKRIKENVCKNLANEFCSEVNVKKKGVYKKKSQGKNGGTETNSVKTDTCTRRTRATTRTLNK